MFYINEGFKELCFGIYNIDDCFPSKSTRCNYRKKERAIIYLKYPKNKKT